MQAPYVKILFFLIAIVVIAMIGVSTPAQAMSEDLMTALNIANGLSTTGTTNFSVGASPAYPPIMKIGDNWMVGSTIEYLVGQPAELFLIMSDPQDRAKIVRLEIMDLSTRQIQKFEVSIDHQGVGGANIEVIENVIIAHLDRLIKAEGTYSLQFSIISKLRARQGFWVLQWNLAKKIPTGSSTVLIIARSQELLIPSRSELASAGERPPGFLNFKSEGGFTNFGSQSRYLISGVDRAEIHSKLPGKWTVNGEDRGISSGPLYLSLGPGSINIRVDNELGDVDEMEIICLGGQAEAKAKANTDIDISPDGTISIKCTAKAEAKAGSQAFVMALSEPEECRVPMPPAISGGGYYPTSLPVFRTDVPLGTWFWNESNSWEQSPYCDPWGQRPMDPPVPAPPGPSSPYVPPIP